MPRWTASQKIAWKQLKYCDKDTFQFLAEHKEELIGMTVEQAMEKGILNTKMNPSAVTGFFRLRAMAEVFDAFMALAEE